MKVGVLFSNRQVKQDTNPKQAKIPSGNAEKQLFLPGTTKTQNKDKNKMKEGKGW